MNRKDVIIAILVIFMASNPQPIVAKQTPTETLLELSLEELMNIEISSSASLTKTKARLVPAAVTTITKEQIQASGARSLFELLDIYVPNFQWRRNDWEAPNMGLRGIINDRDDKYLLLVNGRVMNDHTHFGAISERDLVLLGDIHHIDIIRGPGSALYGPGAIAMVINIVTDNAKTFEGTEVGAKVGLVESFEAAEFRHGRRFNDGDGGIYIYAGAGDYRGASAAHAQQKYAFDFPEDAYYPWNPSDPGPELPCDGLRAGDAAPGIVAYRDGAAARGLPPIKLHAELTRGPWDIWVRFTRGGQHFVPDMGALIHYPYGWGDWVANPIPAPFSAYQQATGSIGYHRELRSNLAVDATFGYDMHDFERYSIWHINEAYREDEYYGRFLVQWDPTETHKLAIGAEVLHGEYGLKSPGWPHSYPRCAQFPTNMPRWSSNMYSILGEWQWSITDRWTAFVGARLDDHTFTKWMFSPRVAIVYMPSDRDTIKLICSSSVRAQLAEEMKKQDMAGLGNSEPEVLKTVELRYERQHNKNLDLAASVFVHYDFDVVSWSGSDSNVIGTQRTCGIELEASYHTERTRLSISHGFTKLYDFDLRPGESTLLTAEPYGFGDDLAMWSNHVTKLVAQHKLDEHWTLDGSLRVYWGFPGLRDWDRYKRSQWADTWRYPAVDPNLDAPYRGNYYLNLGLQYKPSDVLTVGLNGYYLLGIFDEDLNKRNGGNSAYRDHAPALAFWACYRFK
ncbi:MAG: TonB-dependent receptor [Sedimentisphaerales bacterium]|nr:TonB-dependent receptor [Sedimentisphaerales bacterium]